MEKKKFRLLAAMINISFLRQSKALGPPRDLFLRLKFELWKNKPKVGGKNEKKLKSGLKLTKSSYFYHFLGKNLS